MRSWRAAWLVASSAVLASPVAAPAQASLPLIPPHARALLLARAAPGQLRVMRALRPVEVSEQTPAKAVAFRLPAGSQVAPASQWVIATDVTITVRRAPPGSTATHSGAINARAALALVVTRRRGSLQLTPSGLAGEASALVLGRPFTTALLNCPPFGSLRGPENTLRLLLSVERGMRLRILTSRIVLVRVPAKVCGQ